jgi:hypothetical protein
MEKFFTPTRRLQDLWEREFDADDFEYTEVELAVPVEDFLSYHWDWNALYAFASGDVVDKIIWIANDMFLVVGEFSNHFYEADFFWCDDQLHASSVSTSGQEQRLNLAKIGIRNEDIPVSPRAVSVFWRAVVTSNSVELIIYDEINLGLPSGPILSQFLRGSSILQVLTFVGCHFKEEHCSALATLQRHNIEIKLRICKLDPHDAKDTFIEWFRHNQVVTDLDCCDMDSSIISALSGNNSVKKITIDTRVFYGPSSEEKMSSLLRALPGNMGVEHLAFEHQSIHMCDLSYSAESKSTLMNAIIQMLQHNTVVQTIALPDEFNNEEVYQNSILPRLEMNRTCFEVQRQAVKRADPSIRPQLLGRALHVVRYNPNLVFQFLSENVPAFFRAEEAPIILLS